MIRNFVRNEIMLALTDITAKIAEKGRQNASWSSTIPKVISALPVQETADGKFVGTVQVDISKETGAPEAAAFEFGSGIHRKESPDTYVIAPKNASLLAFPWPDHDPNWHTGNKFVGVSGEKFLFRYVDHPGVAARPFMQPAVDEVLPTLRQRLALKLGRAIADGITIEFKRT
jgi:hypothetical protein